MRSAIGIAALVAATLAGSGAAARGEESANLAPHGPRASLASPAATLSADSLVALAARSIRNAAGALPAGATLTCDPIALPQPMALPADATRIDVALADATPAALMTPVCRVYAGGRIVRSVPISMRVRVEAPTLVTTRRVERGEAIAPDAVRSIDGEIAPPWSDALVDPAQVAGRVARRTLAAGEILRPDLLETAPLVRRGQKVLLVLESPSVRILASGTARGDGRLGDEIAVLRDGMKRAIRGRVIGDGRLAITVKAFQI